MNLRRSPHGVPLWIAILFVLAMVYLIVVCAYGGAWPFIPIFAGLAVGMLIVSA